MFIVFSIMVAILVMVWWPVKPKEIPECKTCRHNHLNRTQWLCMACLESNDRSEYKKSNMDGQELD